MTEYPVKPHTQQRTDLQGRRQDRGPQRRLHLQALLQRCIQSTRVGASELAYDEYCDNGLMVRVVKSSRPQVASILLHALLTEYPVKPHTQHRTDLQGQRQDRGPDHPQRRLHLLALLQRYGTYSQHGWVHMSQRMMSIVTVV